LNETRDPCENFYEFTCGQYEKEHAAFSDLIVKFESAISSAEPQLRRCLIDAIFDESETASSAVEKMRIYRNAVLPADAKVVES
jgi:hypothetical protein